MIASLRRIYGVEDEGACGEGDKDMPPVPGKGRLHEPHIKQDSGVKDGRRHDNDCYELEKVKMELARAHGVDVCIVAEVVVCPENDQPDKRVDQHGTSSEHGAEQLEKREDMYVSINAHGRRCIIYAV